jgi:hypothetical protein
MSGKCCDDVVLSTDHKNMLLSVRLKFVRADGFRFISTHCRRACVDIRRDSPASKFQLVTLLHPLLVFD